MFICKCAVAVLKNPNKVTCGKEIIANNKVYLYKKKISHVAQQKAWFVSRQTSY